MISRTRRMVASAGNFFSANQRSTSGFVFKDQLEMDPVAQDLIVQLAAGRSWPAAKSSKTVHRIPDRAFDTAVGHNLELESIRKRGDVLDSDGSLRRSS